MSSFMRELVNPETGKKQKAFCIDDFYAPHRYGYFFRKDNKDVTWEDFDKLQQDPSGYNIYNEDEISNRTNK